MSRPMMALVLISVSLLWGINWPIMKLVVGEIPPFAFRVTSVIAAGLMLLALARLMGEPMRLSWRMLRPLALIALPGVTGWHLLTAFGLLHLGGGRAAIIAYTMPLWAMILSVLLLGERPGARRLLALAIGMAAMAVLVAPDLGRVGSAPWGFLLITGAAIAWAINIVLTKAFAWEIGPLALAGWQLLIGGVPILLLWPLVEAMPDLAAVSPTAWLGLAYVTVVALVFCFSMHVRLVRLLPATVAALSMLAIPIVGLFSSALMLGEPLGWSEGVALLLVIVSLGLVMLPRHRPAG